MRIALIASLVSALSLFGAAASAQDSVPAKDLFARVVTPTDTAPQSIGFYSRGCLAGAVALPVNGPAWQVMRLSRNRNWGMPSLVNYIERLATDAQADGWPGLLIGDMSQPRGGPLPFGHASHQIGLDVDIWFDPMPNRKLTAEEREQISASSYIRKGTNVTLDRSKWTSAHTRLVKRAASYPEVDRIFVNAGIKKQLCAMAGSDRAWLRKVRPWYLHDDHLHVRLVCPPGNPGCKPQDPPPDGDGCGSNLSWWLSPAPYARPGKPTKPAKPPPPLTLAGLPSQCRAVLSDASVGVAGAEINIPLPTARPATN
ncbi:MAG: penicillin-insensitive murein endopeptidase [Bauldia sp.]|nr:penicillin-insensitive murein endopeptidase [Bauldia sp.]